MENVQVTISAMAMVISGQPFLQLPYESRCKIYRQIGVISPEPIVRLECENGRRIPQHIPKILFDTSEAVLADALSVFWSENQFELRNCEDLLRMGTPQMWSSLRDLTIELDIAVPAGSWIPLAAVKNLRSWRKVCIELGAHLPPSCLALKLYFYVSKYGSKDTASIKNVFSSMLELPVLKNMSFEIKESYPSFRFGLGIHRIAGHLLKHLTCPPTERRSPLRFMGLPVGIQYMVLEQAGLVAPGPVIVSKLKGYALLRCLCPRGYPCCDKARYDSSKNCCWSLPTDLFLVNRHISLMCAEIFFSHNKFIMNTGPWFQNSVSAPNGLIWGPTDTGYGPSSPRVTGDWYPETSKFLLAFPPSCIRMLRSVTWEFQMVTNLVILDDELEADWSHTIDFIAQNVQPLSRLTITLYMSYTRNDPRLELDPMVSRYKVVRKLRKLQGLGGVFIYVSWDRNPNLRALELRLQRVAMGDMSEDII
jgi:hypothetical protein